MKSPAIRASGGVSVRMRALRWWCRIVRTVRRWLSLDRTVYVDQRRDEYMAYWSRAASELGAEFRHLTNRVWEISLGDERTRISNYVVPLDDPVTLRLAGNKAYCYAVARAVGTPVPEHVLYTLSQVEEAKEWRRQIDGPVVVKPARHTSSGLGVTTNIVTTTQLESASALASLFCDELLAEKMVAGESCRLLFLGGELVHAVRRTGLRVVGDGESTLEALVQSAGIPDIRRDPNASLTIKAQGLELTATVPDGTRPLVRSLPLGIHSFREVRTAYDEGITDIIADGMIDELRPIISALGTEFAGVDIITLDPSVPLSAGGGIFLEINTTPGIHHHYVTEEDTRANMVAVKVLSHLLRVTD